MLIWVSEVIKTRIDVIVYSGAALPISGWYRGKSSSAYCVMFNPVQSTKLYVVGN